MSLLPQDHYMTQHFLSVVKARHTSFAQLNEEGTVIGALMNGEWKPLAYQSEGKWIMLSLFDECPIPTGTFPPVPPSTLDVYCKLRGWQGGTMIQAIRDLATQGKTFRNRLTRALLRYGCNSNDVAFLLGERV